MVLFTARYPRRGAGMTDLWARVWRVYRRGCDGSMGAGMTDLWVWVWRILGAGVTGEGLGVLE